LLGWTSQHLAYATDLLDLMCIKAVVHSCI